mmetsp:Transcript_43617/g.102850  ORF Transcript_43617/g.102850 Transcript_43617/m.102850 type:complete len:345 (+) Transcript_43617:66-1100(+)|eukprot:CAMPEP_0178422450 /NCGR_PEP_ID=MMETSP0689_2-20121128/27181_1 /TAXON_ID=160604 /ORGANISM="Amphidinium massartii, Strain CS-259" /LENGTH=344 /DNA_ID=CAMNT_0020044017 /DNA_START=59 /DNA_END=1093 /DNA_ORIENTATION=+
MASSTRGFPAFDLQALEAAVHPDRRAEPWSRQMIESFVRALREDGLLYLSNTGVDVDALAAEVRRVTEPVMNLPEAESRDLMATGFPPNGLTRDEAESTAAVVGKGSYSDLCAKWSFSSSGENILPADADGHFKSAWTAAHVAWDDICVRLLNLIGPALGISSTQLWQQLMKEGNRVGLLRFLRYPDVPKDRASDVGGHPERMAPHHDLDVITLLHQTPCLNGFVSLQGLVNGEWVDVPASPQTLVVNFGEALSILSAGAVKATTHRVLSPPADKLEGSARQTLVMFWEPPAEFKLKPLDDSNFGEYTYGVDGMPFGEWLANAVSKLQGASPADAPGVAAAPSA